MKIMIHKRQPRFRSCYACSSRPFQSYYTCSSRPFESYFSLVWFGSFVHPFSHTCNIGQVNCRLKFMYYNTTYNTWTSTQYNTIVNNTKFKDQLEV